MTENAEPTPYTAEDFRRMTGAEPERDDLERLNCYLVGEATHQQCGVCHVHDKPRFVCGCLAAIL